MEVDRGQFGPFVLSFFFVISAQACLSRLGVYYESQVLLHIITAEIARSLDDRGRRGVEATVATTSYRGLNALHAAGGGGNLAVYRYLVEVVKMDVNMWDASAGNY